MQKPGVSLACAAGAAITLTDVTTVSFFMKNSSTILRVAASITSAATSLADNAEHRRAHPLVLGFTGLCDRRVDLGELEVKALCEQHLREPVGNRAGTPSWPGEIGTLRLLRPLTIGAARGRGARVS